MSEQVRVRMLVGREPDSEWPLVYGCVDESMWEIEGEDDTDKRWQRMKDEFSGPKDGEYREVVITVSRDDLNAALSNPVIEATVTTPPHKREDV